MTAVRLDAARSRSMASGTRTSGGAPPAATDSSRPIRSKAQPATESHRSARRLRRRLPLHRRRCRDSDPSGIVVNEIRKDFAGRDQDTFEVLLDTFADRRNGFVFSTNAEGAKADTQIANEGRDVNPNWDAVWWVEAREDRRRLDRGVPHSVQDAALRGRRRHDLGHQLRAARPPQERGQLLVAGVARLHDLSRLVRGRSHRPAAAAAGPQPAHQAVPRSAAPCAASARAASIAMPSAGVDVKAGVTPSLTLDVTINPDFAQAEADEQQVNLTQFSLFFPEKREFFLENSGIFYFGDIPRNTAPGRALPSARRGSAAVLQPPHRPDRQRRSRTRCYGGVRLTGRAGGFGARRDDDAEQGGRGDGRATTTRCVRVRRDVFAARTSARSSCRAQPTGDSDDFNRVAGVDANFRFFRSLSINSFAARSDSPGVTTNQDSGQGVDRLGRQREAAAGVDHDDRRRLSRRPRLRAPHRRHAAVLRRRVAAAARVAAPPRHPAAAAARARRGSTTIRTASWCRGTGHVGDAGRRGTTARTSNTHSSRASRRSRRPFAIYPGVAIPAGRYDWHQHLMLFESDHSRALSGSVALHARRFLERHAAQRCRPACSTARPTAWCSTSACRSATSTCRSRRPSFVSTLVNLRSRLFVQLEHVSRHAACSIGPTSSSSRRTSAST